MNGRDFIEFEPSDITSAFVAGLALKDEEVLNALCKALELHLTVDRTPMTGWRYVVTPKASPSFGGTIGDVACYVKGYATAWAEARRQAIADLDSTIRALKQKRQEML